MNCLLSSFLGECALLKTWDLSLGCGTRFFVPARISILRWQAALNSRCLSHTANTRCHVAQDTIVRVTLRRHRIFASWPFPDGHILWHCTESVVVSALVVVTFCTESVVVSALVVLLLNSSSVKYAYFTRWFKYDRDYLCVNKSQFVPVIFEPPCIMPDLHTAVRARFQGTFVTKLFVSGGKQ